MHNAKKSEYIYFKKKKKKSNKINPKSITAPDLPSERVLTVWGNLADFIIAVKVMISVRSNLLHPVQSPFIKRIRCFWWKKRRSYLNKHKKHKANKSKQTVWSCEYKTTTTLYPQCSDNRFYWMLIHQNNKRVFIPVRLHMLRLGFPSAVMRIQLIPCMLLQLTVADFLVLKDKGSNN